MAEKPNNEKVKETLIKGVSSYGGPHLMNEEEVNPESKNFGIIKRVIFVIDGGNGRITSSRKGILIDTPTCQKDGWINIQVLKSGEGTYLGKCLIRKIMDGDAMGNHYIYLITS